MAARFSHKVFIIGFVLLLVLPNIVMLLNDNTKNSRLVFSLNKPKESIGAFKNFYIENFGLKSELFGFYKSIKTKKFHDDVIPNRVVEGKAGWYFLGNHNNHLLDDSFGNKTITKNELSLITEKIERIKKTLEQKDIDLILVVPPNKHRIYGEFLPYQLSKKPTVLSQLKSHLQKTIDFEIVDLSHTILTQKNKRQLYYRTNTHWTDIGAFYGYKKTMAIIENQTHTSYPQVSLADYEQVLKPIKEADITNMLQLEANEKTIYLEKKTPENGQFYEAEGLYSHFKNSKGKNKLLMYKDSFANAMIPFFNESFGDTWYTTDYNIDYQFIDKIKPDVVIIEIVERNLIHNIINSKKPRE